MEYFDVLVYLVHLVWAGVCGVHGGGGVRWFLVHVEQAGVRRVRGGGGAGACPCVLVVLVQQAGVHGVRGGGGASACPCGHVVLEGGDAGGVGDAVDTAALFHGALGVWSGLVIVQVGV